MTCLSHVVCVITADLLLEIAIYAIRDTRYACVPALIGQNEGGKRSFLASRMALDLVRGVTISWRVGDCPCI